MVNQSMVFDDPCFANTIHELKLKITNEWFNHIQLWFDNATMISLPETKETRGITLRMPYILN